MQRVRIADPEFTYDADDPEGYKAGLFRPGPGLGAKDTGTSVYHLPPGQSVCPYHYEFGEEEWLFVLSGRPSLRTPDGTETLAPHDLVFFPPGASGAHKVTNATDEPVRVLMFSSIARVAASAYPDSDKVGVWTGDKSEHVLVRRAKLDYYDGEA